MTAMFQSITIGGMTIPNRFVHSATCEQMAAPDGSVTDQLLKRYDRLARGGIGLIVPGHMYVHPSGRAHRYQIGIHDNAMLPGLKRLVETVHARGGKIAFQLAHGGRQSPRQVIGQPPLAPSGGRDPVSLNGSKPMDDGTIQETVTAFAAAAGRAADAGADAVQIHAAHGYLVNEFLSPFFNRRSDGWGGSDEGRFRLLAAIVSQCRERLPAEVPITVKLNTNDFTPKSGITPALAGRYAGWLVAMGDAAVEVSCGTYYGFQTIRGDIPGPALARAFPFWMRPFVRAKLMLQSPANRFEAAYNLDAAKMIRPHLDGRPLILVGGMRSIDRMNETITAGPADMIAMSRPFIREPDLVKKFAEGKAFEASCTSCNQCFAAMFNDRAVYCYRKGLSAAKA